MQAIITAGGVPHPEEPLYEYTQGKPKALVDVAGKPMAQWVLDALCDSPAIEEIVLIGLTEESGVQCDKISAYLPSQGGILENIRAGVEKVVEQHPETRHVLVASSDIPAITAETVDWLVGEAMQSDHDIYYSVVSRQVMEKRYPNSNRSYTHLKEAEVCGGDMNVIRALTVTKNEELWKKIIDARKSVLKQASLIGFSTLLLLLLRRLDLESGVKRVTERLDITGRVLFSPYAEIAMDVDKPHQLGILRADMAQKVQA